MTATDQEVALAERTPPSTAGALRLRVAGKEVVADGVVSVTLAHPDGDRLPPWEPGAHLEIRLGDRFIRHYSLCGRAGESEYTVAVRREEASAGGSVFVHDELCVGDDVDTSLPRNHFEMQSASEYVFVAGGIGITPLLAMIERAEAEGARWRLLYLGKKRSTMAFLDRLSDYGDNVSIHPAEENGRVDLRGALGVLPDGTAIHACGPRRLLDAMAVICEERPNVCLRVEHFATDIPDDLRNDAFEIELASTGVVVAVSGDRTILDAVQASGVDAPSSCGAGTCGTCETVVLSGIPEHRDCVLTPEERAEGKYMMICVSRSQSPLLVLDL